MTHILALVASLNALHVHGTKEQCEALADSIADLAVKDSIYPAEAPAHIDEDLKAIREFRKKCERKK